MRIQWTTVVFALLAVHSTVAFADAPRRPAGAPLFQDSGPAARYGTARILGSGEGAGADVGRDSIESPVSRRAGRAHGAQRAQDPPDEYRPGLQGNRPGDGRDRRARFNDAAFLDAVTDTPAGNDSDAGNGTRGAGRQALEKSAWRKGDAAPRTRQLNPRAPKLRQIPNRWWWSRAHAW